jgi:hypothetical protein
MKTRAVLFPPDRNPLNCFKTVTVSWSRSRRSPNSRYAENGRRGEEGQQIPSNSLCNFD